jgi:hypothetical protein
LAAAKPLADTPLRAPDAIKLLELRFAELRTALQDIVTFDRAQLAAGNIPARPTSAPEPIAVEPVYTGERRKVLLVRPCRWTEEGKTFAAGAYRVMELPVEAAAEALRNGYALEPDTPSAATIQSQNGPDYFDFNSQPEIVPDVHMPADAAIKYLDERRNRIIHSAYDRYDVDQRASAGWVGGGERTGTVSVSRPR